MLICINYPIVTYLFLNYTYISWSNYLLLSLFFWLLFYLLCYSWLIFLPVINLYSDLINHWSVLFFSPWLYHLSLFRSPKIELYYLYNWWFTYVTCLYYLSIMFILFISMIDLYFIFNLIITNFHDHSFYDYFIYLNMTDLYYWVIIHLYYLIMIFILFVSLWLIYTTDLTNQ